MTIKTFFCYVFPTVLFAKTFLSPPLTITWLLKFLSLLLLVSLSPFISHLFLNHMLSVGEHPAPLFSRHVLHMPLTTYCLVYICCAHAVVESMCFYSCIQIAQLKICCLLEVGKVVKLCSFLYPFFYESFAVFGVQELVIILQALGVAMFSHQ